MILATKHFNPKGDVMLSCPCCGIYDYNEEFLNNIEALRVSCDFPWVVSSGCRCKKHNAEVSSAKSMGEHVVVLGEKKATAIDILINDRYRLWKFFSMLFASKDLKDYFKDIAIINRNSLHVGRGRILHGIGRY